MGEKDFCPGVILTIKTDLFTYFIVFVFFLLKYIFALLRFNMDYSIFKKSCFGITAVAVTCEMLQP